MKRLAAHDLSVLGTRERALAEEQVAPGERVRFCLVGRKGQALIALDCSIVIVTAAGVTSFEFAEVGDIELNTGRARGSIEIQTGALGSAKADDFWAANDATDRFKLPNSISIATSDLETYVPFVAELRSLISDAKQQAATLADADDQAWDDLDVQLQTLCDGCRVALVGAKAH